MSTTTTSHRVAEAADSLACIPHILKLDNATALGLAGRLILCVQECRAGWSATVVGCQACCCSRGVFRLLSLLYKIFRACCLREGAVCHSDSPLLQTMHHAPGVYGLMHCMYLEDSAVDDIAACLEVVLQLLPGGVVGQVGDEQAGT